MSIMRTEILKRIKHEALLSTVHELHEIKCIEKLIASHLLSKFRGFYLGRSFFLNVHKSTSVNPIMEQINPIHFHSFYFFKTEFMILLVIQSDSKLLSLFPFIHHRNPDYNFA
jgi:hypothetical protein